MRRRVTRVLRELGHDPDDDVVATLCGWLEDLNSWNRKVDLTAARNDDELVDLMLADAAVLAEHLEGALAVVDVGSGAGAPGLPLAILRPDLRVTLVEPMQKRSALLRLSIGRMGLGSTRVVQGRVERLKEQFDVALSRATLAPEAWLGQGARLAPRGRVWVLLAREAAPSRPGWTVAGELAYRWPLTGVERRAVAYRPDDDSAG